MKTKLVFLFAALALIACEKVDNSSNNDEGYFAPATVDLTKAQETVAYGQLHFDIELFKKTAVSEGNVVVSPFSMATAWSMAASAASGDTFDEIADALGFKGCTSADIGSYYSRALESMKPANDTCKLSFANSVWAPHVEIGLSQDFRDEVKKYYSAEIKEIGSDNGKNIKVINDWVKEKTNGLLKNFLDEKIHVVTLLLNVLYFESEWLYSSEYSTGDNMTFANINGTKSNETFFGGSASGTLSYNLECDSIANNAKEPQILSMPYKACNLRMVFMLPPEAESIDNFIASIDVNNWNRWMSSLEASPMSTKEWTMFQIPEFEVETDFDSDFWKSTLSSLGINKAFYSADFSKISCDYVSDVLQSAKIKVSAKGTKAVAVSAVNMKFTSSGAPRPVFYSFIADRPFIYALVEPETQSILFMGTVKSL